MRKRMNQETKLDEIDKKIDKLIQLQDFTTLQNAFLAIFFAILIFVITIILYYKENNILVWAIALLILLYDLLMLIWLLLSILSSNEKDKIHFFRSVLFYLNVSIAATLVTVVFYAINYLLNFTITFNNTIAVLLLFSALLIIISLNRYFEKKYNERFNLLSGEHTKKELYHGTFELIDNVIKKHGKKIYYSGTVSLFLTVITGLWEWVPLRTADNNYYGFPLVWMTKHIDKIPNYEYNFYSLIGNSLIYTIIIFCILLMYSYFKKAPSGKFKDAQMKLPFTKGPFDIE